MRDLAVLGTSDTSNQEDLKYIQDLNANRNPESELVPTRLFIKLWNEEHHLDVAPRQQSIPNNIKYDTIEEKFSFPAMTMIRQLDKPTQQ